MLEYVALGILVFATVTLFYGVIMIHDIPYDIAKHRNHPQQDAIHVAGWISLLTLHVLWPFLWIWATLYREDRGWGFTDKKAQENNSETNLQLIKLQNRIEVLEEALSSQVKKVHDVEDKVHDVEDKVEHPDQKVSHTFHDLEKSIIAEQQGDK
ncbi:DUF3302 domain-containing protein [Psychromonas sp.]|nr:DUF3302 domain-containing protein [Psychromonas sp.]